MKHHDHRPELLLLARTAPFDRFDIPALAPLEPSTDRVHVPTGTVVARDAAPVHEFVVLVSGRLVAEDATGRRRHLLPGATIGGAELWTGDSHHETVVADGEADVLVVNGPAYRWALAELFRGGPLDGADERRADR